MRNLVVLLCLLCLLMTTASWAQTLPPSTMALALGRALAYDRRLATRAGAQLDLAVVYVEGDRSSESLANDLYQAFSDLAKTTVQGMPLRVVRVAWRGPETIARLTQGADVLFLSSGLGAHADALTAAANKAQRLTLVVDEETVRRGATLAVVLDGTRPQIVINLPAAKSAGADFSSDLLRVARVIR